MAGLPFANTTVTVKRPFADTTTRTAYDGPTTTAPAHPTEVVAQKVPAAISTPSATNNLAGGDRITYTTRAVLPYGTTLQAQDKVIEADGTEWRCMWVRPQTGLGIPHLVASLRMVTGAS